MTFILLLSCSLFQMTEGLESRTEALQNQFQMLEAFVLPPEFSEEREMKRQTLQEWLEKPFDSAAEIDMFYLLLEEYRQWLWRHASDKPKVPVSTFQEDEKHWTVTNDFLSLSIERERLAITVATPAHTWNFAPSREGEVAFETTSFSLASAAVKTAEAFDTGYGTGMEVFLSGFQDQESLQVRLTWLLIGKEIILDMAMTEGKEAFKKLNWPPEVLLNAHADTLTVIPRMQGMLLPGNWHQRIQAEELVHSRSFYMPWWGHIEGGSGVQVILETTDDVGGIYDHPEGGPTRLWTQWYASLGRFNYLRTMRLVFDDQADYVSMAKRYRRFVQERGRLVLLSEKLMRTPNLKMVIGKPVIHLGALYHYVTKAGLFNTDQMEINHQLKTFDTLREELEMLYKKGVEAAYVHLDGWGYYGYDNGHPDPLPVGTLQGGWESLRALADSCASMNYLFAVHDQYRDFYYSAASFDDRLTAMHFDGSRDEWSVWCGGPQTVLSARVAPEYVRRNHDLFKEQGIQVKGAYLDVFSVVALEESAQPGQPMTRGECARYRLECFDLLRARGYVVSSEEPVEYTMNALDLVHHAPYPTYPHIGTGAAYGIPVPLFSLVYHDAILVPWDFGENGGWGIPEGDAGKLHCFLNAGLPYLHPTADSERIAETLKAAAWSESCAFSEMTHHAFLEGDWRKQRAEFANGASVVVDFDEKSYELFFPDDPCDVNE